MDILGTDEKPDLILEQMKALDKVIERAGSMLADADEAITRAIDKRGKLAEDVQHLWIKRHQLNQALQSIREEREKERLWPR